MKKIMLGTSDAWLMSLLSQRPNEPAYYIEDCQISCYYRWPECHGGHQTSKLGKRSSQALHRLNVLTAVYFVHGKTDRCPRVFNSGDKKRRKKGHLIT